MKGRPWGGVRVRRCAVGKVENQDVQKGRRPGLGLGACIGEGRGAGIEGRSENL